MRRASFLVKSTALNLTLKPGGIWGGEEYERKEDA